MSSDRRTWWQRLTGKGITESITDPMESELRERRHATLQAEYDALRSAAEGSHEPVLDNLAASRLAELRDDAERAAYGEYSQWIGRGS